MQSKISCDQWTIIIWRKSEQKKADADGCVSIWYLTTLTRSYILSMLWVRTDPTNDMGYVTFRIIFFPLVPAQTSKGRLYREEQKHLKVWVLFLSIYNAELRKYLSKENKELGTWVWDLGQPDFWGTKSKLDRRRHWRKVCLNQIFTWTQMFFPNCRTQYSWHKLSACLRCVCNS